MGNSFWVRHRITPVTTRYIRIRVAGMDERISKFYKAVLQPCMRFEVYGCAKPGTTEPPLATLPPIPTTRKNIWEFNTMRKSCLSYYSSNF